MNRKCLIISGGTIEPSFAVSFIRNYDADVMIAVDRGLVFLHAHGMIPTHIVGDFDSVDPKIIAHYKELGTVPIREFNPVKDASDSEIGLRLAIELGVSEICLLGCTGTRLDHVMANIQMLMIARDAGVQAYLQDECNRISIHKSSIVLERESVFGDYFSIFPFGGIVESVSIKGAKYLLENYRLCPNDSRCVSNEMKDDRVEIQFPEGMILLMETRDKG